MNSVPSSAVSPVLTTPLSSKPPSFKRHTRHLHVDVVPAPQTQHFQTSLPHFLTLCFEEWKMNPDHGPMSSLTSPPVHLSPSLLFFFLDWGIIDYNIILVSGVHRVITPSLLVSICEMPSESTSFLSFPHCHCPRWEAPLHLLSSDLSIPRSPSCSSNQFSNSSGYQPHKRFGKQWSLILTVIYFNTWFSQLSRLKNMYPHAKWILMEGVHHWLYLLNLIFQWVSFFQSQPTI